METPAMLCEMGNSATVASFADPPSPTQPRSLSMLYLKFAIGSGLCSSGAGSAFIADAAAMPSDAAVTASKRSRRLMAFSSAMLPLQIRMKRL
jgi:hypothetical protein